MVVVDGDFIRFGGRSGVTGVPLFCVRLKFQIACVSQRVGLSLFAPGNTLSTAAFCRFLRGEQTHPPGEARVTLLTSITSPAKTNRAATQATVLCLIRNRQEAEGCFILLVAMATSST